MNCCALKLLLYLQAPDKWRPVSVKFYHSRNQYSACEHHIQSRTIWHQAIWHGSAQFHVSGLLPLDSEAVNRCPRTSWGNEPEPRNIFSEAYSISDLLIWHIGRCRDPPVTTESNVHCNFIIPLYSKCLFAMQPSELWTHTHHRLSSECDLLRAFFI